MRPDPVASATSRRGDDGGHPALTVTPRGGTSAVRRSRTSRWRAAVLIGVHVAIAAHVTHFMLAGRTLSPVEPSESMYTIELGQVNAGFVFFVVALLATAVFGRFFCGWGCHIVALQDLCGWLLRRMGIRPRPFRSRLLAFAPLGIALYMFVWPTAKRWLGLTASTFPGFSNHMVTDGFWDTFPGPLFAVLTFAVCGFAAVWFLGSKGFCTYGCPYGAFFAGADRLSPFRIVVNDDCEQCGHCTATCTSNVVVHDEVRRYGMVVSAGCMKCMDCVSVCPNGALSLGFARPALGAGPRRGETAARAPRGLDIVTELGLGAIFLAALLTFRGLYDGPPLLMSAGLAGITAYVAWLVARLVRRRPVRLQSLALVDGGALTPSGRVAVALGVAWLVFALHSGWMQTERALGAWHLERTAAARADVIDGSFRDRAYPASHAAHAAASFRHFRRASRFGLVAVPEVEAGLAWGHLLAGRDDEAVAAIERALAAAPGNARLHRDLARLLYARGRVDEAIVATRRQLDAGAGTPSDRARLGALLVERGRYPEAVEAFARSVDEAPDDARVRLDYGALLSRMGRTEDALQQLRAAVRLAPDDPDAAVELGLALAAVGRADDALAEFRRALALDGVDAAAVADLVRRLEDGAPGTR